MITQEEKEDFLSELESFIESDFSSVDLVNFILENSLAQELLLKVSYYDYDDELKYINNCELSTIEYVLNMHHDDYYDFYYGSEDPISAFRLSKEDIEDCNTLDDLRNNDYDNILTHLLNQLDEEPIEIELEDILNTENLDKLMHGKIDCRANQIYYFEEESGYNKFIFHHYFRNNNSSWNCNYFECDVADFDTIIDIFKFENSIEAFEAYIAYFYNQFRNNYIQNLYHPEFGSSQFYKYLNTTLDSSVYNGEIAIKQLREFIGRTFHQYWYMKKQDCEKEINDLKDDLISLLEEHKETLDTVFLDNFKSFVRIIQSTKDNEIWKVNQLCHFFIDYISFIEKRSKEIEQLNSKVHELEVHLKYERSKNEVLELELMRKKND